MLEHVTINIIIIIIIIIIITIIIKHDSDVAGVRWSSYSENPHLQDFFKVLSLSADRDQRIYISTIEAHKVKLCH